MVCAEFQDEIDLMRDQAVGEVVRSTSDLLTIQPSAWLENVVFADILTGCSVDEWHSRV